MTPHLVDDVELRRVLRPAAWTVWTAVLGHAECRADGSWFAAVSLRSLAAELGLAKDTVAGCMQRLIRHGLVERCRQAQSNGRFVPSGYIVRPTATMSDLDPVDATTIASVASSASIDVDEQPTSLPRPTGPPTTLTQLSLLGDV